MNSDARLRSEVKEVFSRIDTNRDGFIDQDELLALLKTIHPAITPQVCTFIYTPVIEDPSHRLPVDRPLHGPAPPLNRGTP